MIEIDNAVRLDQKETLRMVVESAKDFSEQYIRPYLMEWDESQHFPVEALRKAGSLGFMGVLIPEAYGGMGFSANAMNLILGKIGSRSVPLCVDIMVPNSLGPGELINHYGTQKQKDFYLPRLAKGEDIPCFALTEPNAGSDASSISSSGTVFKGDDGKEYKI